MFKNMIVVCAFFIAGEASADYLASAECKAETYFSNIDVDKKTGLPFPEGADMKFRVLFTERHYLFHMKTSLIDDSLKNGDVRITMKKDGAQDNMVFIDNLLDKGMIVNGKQYQMLTPEELTTLRNTIETDFSQHGGLPSRANSLMSTFKTLPGLRRDYQVGTESCGPHLCKRITLSGEHTEVGEKATYSGSILMDLSKKSGTIDTPWGKLIAMEAVSENLNVTVSTKIGGVVYKHKNHGCESRIIDDSEFNIDISKMVEMPKKQP